MFNKPARVLVPTTTYQIKPAQLAQQCSIVPTYYCSRMAGEPQDLQHGLLKHTKDIPFSIHLIIKLLKKIFYESNISKSCCLSKHLIFLLYQQKLSQGEQLAFYFGYIAIWYK